ncbi:nucleolar complex protein 4 [Pelomyxa schiedti]|nr:nucleolar complex protein 4 [Pelomyxa schiedti]
MPKPSNRHVVTAEVASQSQLAKSLTAKILGDPVGCIRDGLPRLLEMAQVEESVTLRAALEGLVDIFRAMAALPALNFAFPTFEHRGKRRRCAKNPQLDDLNKWCTELFCDMQKRIDQLLHSTLEHQTLALDILMRMSHNDSQSIIDYCTKFLVHSDSYELLEYFLAYLSYDDVAVFVMTSLKDEVTRLQESTNIRGSQEMYSSATRLLLTIPLPPLPTATTPKTLNEMQTRKFYTSLPPNTPTPAAVYGECWQALLSVPHSKAGAKQILEILAEKILPYLPEPLFLMDFLVDTYNFGGVLSLLCVESLLLLITQHNIEFPDFFLKVYNLLEPSILCTRHVSQFFQLLEKCLSSSYIPAASVAAFIKRLARLSLTAPTPTLPTLLALSYNLMFVHRHTRLLVDVKRIFIPWEEDPFDFFETDPLKTCALDSWLWEYTMLQNHYLPAVSKLAVALISSKFDRQLFYTPHFSGHSYKTLTEAELKRHNKPAPLGIVERKTLLDEPDDEPFSLWARS